MRPERARVADRVPHRAAAAVRAGDHVVEEQRALAQRLERGAALRQAAVAPRQQHLLAALRRAAAEALEAAAADRGQQRACPTARAAARPACARPRAGSSRPRPISACGTPTCDALGAPFVPGANVSQIASEGAPLPWAELHQRPILSGSER